MFEPNPSRQSDLAGQPSAQASPSFFDTLSTVSLFLFFVVAVTFLSALLTSTAQAQSAALGSDPATLATSAEESSNQKSFAYSGQFVFETARTADEAQPESFSGYYLLTTSATHRQTALTATLRLGYVREYSYRRDDDSEGAFDNPLLSVSKSFLNERDFNLSWLDSVSISLNGSIGANAESARRTFLWSNGLAVTLAKSFSGFNLRQAFGYTHGFYDYDRRGDGTVNSPDSVRSTSSLYYDINSKLSIGGAITYSVANSFQGVTRGQQLSQATIDYSISEKIAASVGVGNERFTLETNGQSDRIRFITPETAQYFVDLIVLL